MMCANVMPPTRWTGTQRIGEHCERGDAGHAIGGKDVEAAAELRNFVGARVALLAEGVPPGRASPRRRAVLRLFEQRLCVIRRVRFVEHGPASSGRS